MTGVTIRVLVGSCAIGLLVVGVNAADPTFSLAVVSVNGQALAEPTTSTGANPGDVISVELRLRDWSPKGQGLRGYQATIALEGYSSGASGNIHPVDFAVTTDLNGLCTADGSTGVANPAGALIDPADPLFVYAEVDGSIIATDTLACGYRFAGAVTSASDAPVSAQDQTDKYCGSLMLEVSADAEGTFTLGFLAGEATFLRDENGSAITPLAIEDLTVTVGDVPVAIVGSDPPNGAIDARQPSTLNCSESFGWAAIDITFGSDAGGVTASDFTVTVDPPDVAAPNIVGALADGDALSVTLDGPIPPGHWTIFTHEPSATSTRLGALPADVNGDGTSSPLDILAIIDALNGVGDPLPAWSTDVNRSGASNSADILRVIDLLNGADCFDEWNGAALP